ncbi:phenylalanine--tRNA ligase subunit beta [Patescibacteria group bacterium]|nr:phenylalanine--tRNA ligase subunit beta [Patescibacteria group bacterium]
MNIQITHSHLLEYLDTKATPKQIEKYLSLCGPSIESVTKINNDYVYDIEVTTNRVDMMSVAGIAREAAAILPQFNIKAKFIPPQLAKIENLNKSLPIAIKDPSQTCHRILAIVLDNVNLAPSKDKIKSRLQAANIRSLNNVIDITNYVMTEIGHPTHVFDYDRLKTKKLILRKAEKGEKIVSLEDKTYTLPGGDNVIDDGTGTIIDLPGIIGTKNSIVVDSTKRILFFLETNDSAQIRKTSMTLGIRTNAATLNEKWVDPELAIIALKRGVQLFKDLTGASVASNIVDIYPAPHQPKNISAPLQLIKERLGIEITNQEVSTILKSLGFNNNFDNKTQKFNIVVPSFRNKDVSIPEDIVEEVARIYGFHRLPSTLMSTSIPTNYPNENFDLEYQIKTYLTGFGINEIYTNSLISENLAVSSKLPLNSHLKIKNALSEEWLYLRRSLVPSHLEALKQPKKDLSFFEIANTYHPKKTVGSHPSHLPEERLELIISTTNSYLYLKGVLESLLEKLHLKVEFKPAKNSAEIYHHSTLLGTIEPSGRLPEVQIVLLNLRSILKLAKAYPNYQPLSSHPPIIEDLTFTLPQKTYLGPVIETIQSTHKLINKVTLTKTYQSNYTFNITYQSILKPLSDNLITPIRKLIVTNLKTKHSASLVGKI